MDWLLALFDPGHSDLLLGIFGSLFGSKPKRPAESENDKALADISRGQFRRYNDKFAPLTERLDALSQEDKSATLRGRGNADVMQSMGSPRAPAANGRMASALRTGTRALGTAMSGGSEQARERSSRLTKGVMDAATGAGQSAIRGLGQATQLTTGRAIQKMNIDMMKSRAVSEMLGAVAGGASAVGMNSGGGGTTTKPGTFARSSYNSATGKGGAGSGISTLAQRTNYPRIAFNR